MHGVVGGGQNEGPPTRPLKIASEGAWARAAAGTGILTGMPVALASGLAPRRTRLRSLRAHVIIPASLTHCNDSQLPSLARST